MHGNFPKNLKCCGLIRLVLIQTIRCKNLERGPIDFNQRHRRRFLYLNRGSLVNLSVNGVDLPTSASGYLTNKHIDGDSKDSKHFKRWRKEGPSKKNS